MLSEPADTDGSVPAAGELIGAAHHNVAGLKEHPCTLGNSTGEHAALRPHWAVSGGDMWSGLPSVRTGAQQSTAGRENAASGTAPFTEAQSPVNPRSELSLVSAVLAGDGGATARFVEYASPTVWSAVTRLEGDGAQGELAFLHVVAALKADGYARLKAFDGRARLSTYLALVARDILAERLARRFTEAPDEAWRRFARFFERDIRRRVSQRFPRAAATSMQDDAYQEICLKLVEGDYRRIRAYGGRGSFIGYVLTTVDRLLIDLVRRDAPRRRLPAAVARLSALDQAVYVATAWEGCPTDVERLVVRLRGRIKPDPDPAEIRQALGRLADAARSELSPPKAESVSLEAMVEEGGGLAIADPAPTPEDQLLLAEEERHRAALVAAVKAAAAGLPASERLYLQTVFAACDPLSARDIAKVMGCSVEEAYRLKQRTQRWMKKVAADLEKKASDRLAPRQIGRV
jgi:RNA polymerase primary sigma factor